MKAYLVLASILLIGGCSSWRVDGTRNATAPEGKVYRRVLVQCPDGKLGEALKQELRLKVAGEESPDSILSVTRDGKAFRLELVDAKDHRTVWTGTARDTSEPRERLSEMAEQVVDRLESDGLLPPKPHSRFESNFPRPPYW